MVVVPDKRTHYNYFIGTFEKVYSEQVEIYDPNRLADDRVTKL